MACKKERGDGGFGLLETLAALAIAAIVAGVLIKSFSLAARSNAQAEDAVATALFADTIMTRLRLQPGPIRDPVLSGFDEGYRWRATLALVPVADHLQAAHAPSQSQRNASSQQTPDGPSKTSDKIILYKVRLDVQAPTGRNFQMETLVAKSEEER